MKSIKLFVITLLLLTPVYGWSSPPQVKPVKNVIILIPDGMSVGATTLARWFQGGQPLALDEMAAGLVRTYNSDTPIGDSAPAGSAFATGYKSQTGQIASLPVKVGMPGVPLPAAGQENRPLATVLEAARLAGKSTGLVATSEIMHATPADFSAHSPSRKAYDDLSEQQVHNRLDVVFGGGAKFLEAKGRKDGEDMFKALKEQGYEIIKTPAELELQKKPKVWGLFAPADLAYELDRNPANQPSLADMTARAIALLSKNPNGFFLMVEGSKIDWAAHANDPVGIISDVLAFDRAVKVALDFAKLDGATVVISTSDHGNSGISMGDRATSGNYDKVPLASFIAPLKRAKGTAEKLAAMLNRERSNVREVVASQWGINDLNDAELAGIVNCKEKTAYAFGPVMAKRAHIGFTTNGHTGEDVVWYAWSPRRDHLTGVLENTDVALLMAHYLGVDLHKTTDTLFVEAETGFTAKGAATGTDRKDPQNPVLTAKKGGTDIRLPRNRNYALVNGRRVELPGVTVFNGKKWYTSQAAVDLLK